MSRVNRMTHVHAADITNFDADSQHQIGWIAVHAEPDDVMYFYVDASTMRQLADRLLTVADEMMSRELTTVGEE